VRHCDRTRRSFTSTCASLRIRAVGADDDIVDAISIDVACSADGDARVVAHIDAGKYEATTAVATARRVQTRERHERRKRLRRPEHNVAFAGIRMRHRIGGHSADDEIVDAVSVDVAGFAH